MKIGGIVFLVIAALNLIIVVAAIGEGYSADAVSSQLGGIPMFGFLGAFMLNRAKKKKQEEEDKKKWSEEK